MNVNKDAGDVCDVGLIVRDLASSIISDDKETMWRHKQEEVSWCTVCWRYIPCK